MLFFQTLNYISFFKAYFEIFGLFPFVAFYVISNWKTVIQSILKFILIFLSLIVNIFVVAVIIYV